MAISVDWDLVKDTSVGLIYSKLGVLQYGRITRCHLMRGLNPGTLDANGTDPTIPSVAIDYMRTKIPVTTPHPNSNYSTLLARDYTFNDVRVPGMGEVIVAYVFDSPLNPDYTLDCDSWIEEIESWRYQDASGNWKPFKVANYTVNWTKDTDPYPSSPQVLPPAFSKGRIFIPRAKWVVTKTTSSVTATNIQNVKGDYLRRTNNQVIFNEPIGTVLCSRIATATEPWLGRATVTAEFLVRPEGWDVYQEYSNVMTNGVPPNVWLAHTISGGGGSVSANGVETFTPQPPANLQALLSQF